MKCGNRSPSRWGFRRKDEENEGPGRIESFMGPDPEDGENEQAERMDMPSKRGICAGCGKERTLLAHGKCWKCNGYGQKKAKKQKPAGVPAELAPEKVKFIREKIRAAGKKSTTSAVVVDKLPDPLPIAEIKGEAAALISPDPRIVLLDFTLPENADLYDTWVKYSRSHRRGPDDQAMMAIEEILTNEGLI